MDHRGDPGAVHRRCGNRIFDDPSFVEKSVLFAGHLDGDAGDTYF
jgi:hypothetical protein